MNACKTDVNIDSWEWFEIIFFFIAVSLTEITFDFNFLEALNECTFLDWLSSTFLKEKRLLGSGKVVWHHFLTSGVSRFPISFSQS